MCWCIPQRACHETKPSVLKFRVSEYTVVEVAKGNENRRLLCHCLHMKMICVPCCILNCFLQNKSCLFWHFKSLFSLCVYHETSCISEDLCLYLGSKTCEDTERTYDWMMGAKPYPPYHLMNFCTLVVPQANSLFRLWQICKGFCSAVLSTGGLDVSNWRWPSF